MHPRQHNHFCLWSSPTVSYYWKFKRSNIQDKKNPKVAIWDYKNFNSKSFQSDIKEIDLSLATENNDVDLGFKTFKKLFSRTLDKHIPYKEIRKKNEIETETLKTIN